MSDIIEYTDEVQELFVRFLISDSDLFARTQAILKPEYFSYRFQKTIVFVLEHVTNHAVLPTFDQIAAVTRIKYELLSDITENHQEWFLDEFETFCRRMAYKGAVIKSSEMLDTDEWVGIEDVIKQAAQVALVRDLGLDYFSDPRARLDYIRNQAGATSTGWKTIDDKLYGGVNRGELTLIAGCSGAGKSVFLQNFAVNWALAGLNVVYISLELSEQLISLRLDSMVTGIATREVMRNIDDVELKVKIRSKTAGKLRVKYMPSGSPVNAIRAYIKEYEIQSDIKVDAILVDYLDLLMPSSIKVNPSDMFIKDKYVSEELRNIAMELQLLMVSASQLNRSGVDEHEYSQANIAGGISKVMTCDNLIGIFTSNAMRERGRYQLQFLKTRSSSGVGSKIDLGFNIDTLRVSDLEDGDTDAFTASSNSIVDQLRRNNSMTPGPGRQEPANAIDESLRLRDFIKKKPLN